MNLNALQKYLPAFDEIRLLQRPFIRGSVEGQLVGLIRQGNCCILALLECDQAAREAEPVLTSGKPRTHRERLMRDSRQEGGNLLPFPQSVTLGGIRYPVESGSGGLLENNWQDILGLEELLRRGWQPGELGRVDFSFLHLTGLRLEGEFDRLPETGEEPVVLSVPAGTNCVPVSGHFVLPLGPGPEIAFSCLDGAGTERRFYVNDLTLRDLRAEQLARLESPEFREKFSPEELEKARINLEESMDRICPEGMVLPVVEYETDGDFLLEFFETSWLDSPLPMPVKGKGKGATVGASSAIIFMHEKERRGPRGLPRHTAIVHCPVPTETEHLELEVLRCHIPFSEERIEI